MPFGWTNQTSIQVQNPLQKTTSLRFPLATCTAQNYHKLTEKTERKAAVQRPSLFKGTDKHRPSCRMTYRGKVFYSVCSTCQTASHPSSRWSPAAAALCEDDHLNQVVLLRNDDSLLLLIYRTFRQNHFPSMSSGFCKQYKAAGWRTYLL